MTITPLSEGSFTIDSSKLFVPFNESEDELQERPVGSLLVEIQPFLIKTERDLLLLDTGLGFSTEDGGMQIHKNLQGAGVEAGQITKVLLSHLHKDHAGGVGDSQKRLAFPNATYYIQGKELDFAFEKGFPSFITEELEVLKGSSSVKLLADPEGSIDDYIEYEVTGAHSPYHQVFWIREGGQIIFFGADDAPQLHQMKHRFVAKYDFDGRKAMELRRQWWQIGKEKDWSFLFYHDVKAPIVRGSEMK